MSIRIEQLGGQDVETLRSLLARDVPTNLFLLGLLEEFGISPTGEAAGAFFGHFVAEELTAALFIGGTGGLVAPSANAVPDIAALAEPFVPHLQLRTTSGEANAVDAVLKSFGAKPATVRNTHLYSVSADDLGPFTNPTLRLAREDEVDRVLPLSARALQEIYGADPSETDSAGFRDRVERRIKAKRTYVLEVDGALVFKVDIGSRSRNGAELEALYTVKNQRERGHATLSLGQISRHLLSSLPKLVLRVDDENHSLARMARKVGYVAGKAMRTAVMV